MPGARRQDLASWWGPVLCLCNLCGSGISSRGVLGTRLLSQAVDWVESAGWEMVTVGLEGCL